MTEQVIIQIDLELKKQLAMLARGKGKNFSELVTELIEAYVQNREIAACIDDLWRRIGGRLKSRKIGSKGIRQAIEKARTGK